MNFKPQIITEPDANKALDADTIWVNETTCRYYPSLDEATENLEEGEEVCLVPFVAGSARYFRATEGGVEEIEDGQI